MPMKTHKRYWTLSTDGNRTPIEVFETVEDSSTNQPHQQIQQYVQTPSAIQPYHQVPSVMVRPEPRSPIPFMAGAAGLFLCFYSWNSAQALESLKQQNAVLTQQVATLQAQNQALKEMASIVR